MRRKYEESDNVLVNTARVLTDRFRDMFGSVMEETEHGQALAELREIDPTFQLEQFMRETREFMIPEVMEAFVHWDTKELKEWCSDGVYNILEVSRDHSTQQGYQIEGRLLDIRNVEVRPFISFLRIP